MEIKFRAYHKSRDVMYDVFSFCDDYVKIKHKDNSIEKLPREEFEELMQLWKPSLNLKVYTGDLLEAVCSPSGSKNKKLRICKVDFSPRGMDIAVWYKKEWWRYGSMDFTSVKVIGNIYQNSDLLN